MKKIYIAPEMEIVAIEMSQIICTSLPTEGTTSGGGITTADSPGLYFDWDDDDE